jgi:hypothetical protein
MIPLVGSSRLASFRRRWRSAGTAIDVRLESKAARRTCRIVMLAEDSVNGRDPEDTRQMAESP